MKTKLMFRWSLVTGGLIALFWAIYYLFAGSVPIVESIKITKTWSVPFGISRWWDILIGPWWSIITIYLLTKIDKDNYHSESSICLVITFFGSIFTGAISCVAIYLDYVLSHILILGITTGLIISFVTSLIGLSSRGLIYGLIYGLTVGLIVALIIGLTHGLIVSLVICSGMALGLVFIALIQISAKKSFWGKFGRWIMAKE